MLATIHIYDITKLKYRDKTSNEVYNNMHFKFMHAFKSFINDETTKKKKTNKCTNIRNKIYIDIETHFFTVNNKKKTKRSNENEKLSV